MTGPPYYRTVVHRGNLSSERNKPAVSIDFNHLSVTIILKYKLFILINYF